MTTKIEMELGIKFKLENGYGIPEDNEDEIYEKLVEKLIEDLNLKEYTIITQDTLWEIGRKITDVYGYDKESIPVIIDIVAYLIAYNLFSSISDTMKDIITQINPEYLIIDTIKLFLPESIFDSIIDTIIDILNRGKKASHIEFCKIYMSEADNGLKHIGMSTLYQIMFVMMFYLFLYAISQKRDV